MYEHMFSMSSTKHDSFMTFIRDLLLTVPSWLDPPWRGGSNASKSDFGLTVFIRYIPIHENNTL